jgi:hypothetical protein
MTPEVYRLVHVGCVLLLFLGLGGVLATSGRDGAKAPGWCLAMHGIGLIGMVVAGVGFAHKSEPPLGWPNWLLAKIGLWLLLGAVPFLLRRGLLPRFLAFLIVLGAGVAAAWLARGKPF